MRASFSNQAFIALFALLATAVSTAHAQTEAKATPPDPLTWQGVLQAKDVTESSGLARSSEVSNAFWTMNDSGNGTDLFLFHEKGKSLARCEMTGLSLIHI